MKKKLSYLLILLFLILAGCNNKEEIDAAQKDEPKQQEDKQQTPEKNNEDEAPEEDEQEVAEDIPTAPPLPTTLEELDQLAPGYTEYLSLLEEADQKKIDELTAHLPDISGEPSKEELDRYYEALLAVFQQDYKGPEDLINSMKFQAIGSPDIEDPRYQFKVNLNVMVILDASGSMANYEGNQTRMEAAKQAINNFVKGLPESANVGLRIYGHEGTGNKEDKALSCSSSELVYPISQYNAGNFDTALTKAKPAGWTPIGLALNESQKDLATFKGDTNTNIIYLVSDGISTCDDDPVGAAKALFNSDITPIVNVIGFNVDNEGQKQLKEVAEAVEGSYQNVKDAQGLQDQLNEAGKVAEKWEQWKTEQEGWLGYYQVSNHLDIFVYHSQEFRKWVDEGQQVGFTLQYLYQTKDLMSRESHDYLRQKNSEYHDWIEQEYAQLKKDLEALNEKNYVEAVKALENKYLENTTTP